MLVYKYFNYFYIKGFIFKQVLNEIFCFFVELKYCFSQYKLIAMPYKIKKFTVVKSPFVSKLSREQFEIRVYKVLLILESKDILIFNSKKVIRLQNCFKNCYVT